MQVLHGYINEVYDGNGSFYSAHRDNEHHVHNKGDMRPWVSCSNDTGPMFLLNLPPTSPLLLPWRLAFQGELSQLDSGDVYESSWFQ